jgi:hypothetical protein
LIKLWNQDDQKYSVTDLPNSAYLIKIRDEQNMEIRRSRLIIAH